MPLQSRTLSSPGDVGERSPQICLQHDADVSCPSSRSSRYSASVRSVVDESSMSIRTNLPRAAASPTTASRFSRQRSRSSSRPSAVSLTEMFASRPSSSMPREHVVVLRRRSRAPRPALAISSPSTSTVASFPFAFSRRRRAPRRRASTRRCSATRAAGRRASGRPAGAGRSRDREEPRARGMVEESACTYDP